MSDDPAMRADARANRDRLLDTARDMLAATPDVSMNAIAKAAGVGAGTLYRHFPSREALVLGVYRKEIDALVALAPQLIASHPAIEAFRLWCDRLACYGRVKHGVAEVLHAAMTDRDLRETYGPMVEALRQLLEGCARAGDFRKDTDPEDILLLLGFLWRLPPGPEAEQRAARLIELVIRGLRAPGSRRRSGRGGDA